MQTDRPQDDTYCQLTWESAKRMFTKKPALGSTHETLLGWLNG